MKNQWSLWIFIICVIGVVLFAFNYQGGQDSVPLSEIFPEDTAEAPIQYEFVGAETTSSSSEEVPIQTTASSTPESDIVIAETASPAPTAAPTEIPSRPPTPAGPTVSSQASVGTYTIQVSSFRDRSRAEQALKEVKEAGYAASIVSKDLGAKGTWHRIYVGSFPTQKAAEETLTKIKKDYSQSFIRKP